MMKFFALALMLVTVSCVGKSRATANGSPDYDPTRETVLSGTVKRTELHVHDGPPALHLIVAGNGQDVVVHVAPPSFLKQQGFEFRAGDQVTIIGSLQKDEPHYHARVVTKGDRALTLRDARGFPLWEKPRGK
jgi:hypothetical protein